MRSKNGKARVVRVLERQRVLLPPQFDTARIKERLISAAEAAGMRDALENRRRGLFAKGAVGVIDIGEVAIEILPKTREGATPEEGRAFLVDLLQFVGRDRGQFATATANIRDSEGGLAEVLYAWAAATAARYADVSLPRRYVPRVEVSTAVRGRIDMKRVALSRPGRAFELVIRHAPLSDDNDIVRAVRWIVHEVAFRTNRSETRRVALALLTQLNGVSEVVANAALFDRILLRPLEEHWAPLLSFGCSLARQKSLDPASAGSQPSVAVLFTLHDLFERAVRRVLQDHGPSAGLQPAHIPRYLLRTDRGEHLLSLKPDFVLRLLDHTGDRLAIGDAKWKDMWTNANTPEPGREDVYQLAAYMTAGSAKSGFLVAPLVGGSGSELLRISQHTMTGTNTRVDVIGIHVATLLRRDATGEKLRKRLCAELAAAIGRGT